MDFDRVEPDAGNGYQSALAGLILASHRRLTGRDLLPPGQAPAEQARQLYEAPFVVLAHDTAADPVFVYGNLAAQRRFELPWSNLVRLPSRYSAEPLARDERARLLERVMRDGFIDDYSGVRVSATGRRFRVTRATVWNVVDEDGNAAGQAAAFGDWTAISAMPGPENPV